MIQNYNKALTFVSLQPPAVSGQGGHYRLYFITCTLVVNLDLTPQHVWELLCNYNLRCKPPWSKAELIHKMADASRINAKFWEETDLAQLMFFPENYTLPDGQEIDCDFGDRTPSAKKQGPDLAGFGPGSDQQLQLLSDQRGISIPGLLWARERGLLVFGYWCGLDCWGVTDSSGSVLELRRLDGKTFPAVGGLAERKAHTVRGSSKRHPVGITEAEKIDNVVLVEGGPDLLAAHDLIQRKQSDSGQTGEVNCAPVAMLSANVAIDPEALLLFKGKYVRIFYHNDVSGAGMKGARHWQQQIVKAGAFSCDFFHFGKITDTTVKDLNDYIVALDGGQLSPGQHALDGFYS